MKLVKNNPFENVDLQNVSVSEKVFLALRDAIIKGTLKPGKRLKENDMVKLLNVSRTPLREAFVKLESEGLIVKNNAGWYRVAEISTKEIKELVQIRSVMEGLACKEAVKRINSHEIEKLKSLVNDLIDSDDDVEKLRLGTEFHNTILQVADNEKLISLYRIAMHHFIRYKALTISIHGRRDEAGKEHIKILNAFVRRDGAEAEALMRQHIINGGEGLLKKLTKLEKVEDLAEAEMCREDD